MCLPVPGHRSGDQAPGSSGSPAPSAQRLFDGTRLLHPILFQLGDLPVPAFGVLLAAGFVLGTVWTLMLARSRGIPPRVIENLCGAALLGGLIGARALDVLVHRGAYREEPWRALYIWEGGAALLGGLGGALLLGWIVLARMRQPLGPAADVVTPGLFLGLAIGSLGSLLAGDDFGRPAAVAWAIRFPDLEGSKMAYPLLDVPLHPTQIYHAAIALSIFALASLFLKWRRRAPGQVFALALLLYAGGRFVLDDFRGDDVARGYFGPYSTSQWLCLGLAPASLLLLVAAGVFGRRRGSPA